LSPERIRLEAGHPPIHSVLLLDPEGPEALDALIARVRERALAEGILEGIALAQKNEAGALAKAAEQLDSSRKELGGELAHSAVELGVAIADQLIHTEVQQGHHDIEKIVREALESASAGRSRCVVHIHPEDFEALRDIPFRSGTSVQADIGVARGDVQVETSMGLMVREIEESLDSIRTRLREEFR
jgi:flagellar assembly protein FliH